MNTMTATEERKARKRVNDALYDLGRIYWDSLPIRQFDELLTTNGFSETEPAIYCGREGSSMSNMVGSRTWFSFTWHKMESGRYEIVAYCN